MPCQQSHVHHYVPRWYQRRFLPPGQSTFSYLTLHPTIVYSNGVRHERRALLRWGPDRCFCQDDLYTLNVGNLSTDVLEKRFFGDIDNRGRAAVKLFGDYGGTSLEQNVPEAFHNLVRYMDAQRFRTPRGLDRLRAMVQSASRNETLLIMQGVFRFHTTMWAEAVWEIARARQSPTKFIVTDDPVTFFNHRGFPGLYPYPDDVGLEHVGTRTSPEP